MERRFLLDFFINATMFVERNFVAGIRNIRIAHTRAIMTAIITPITAEQLA